MSDGGREPIMTSLISPPALPSASTCAAEWLASCGSPRVGVRRRPDIPGEPMGTTKTPTEEMIAPCCQALWLGRKMPHRYRASDQIRFARREAAARRVGVTEC